MVVCKICKSKIFTSNLIDGLIDGLISFYWDLLSTITHLPAQDAGDAVSFFRFN